MTALLALPLLLAVFTAIDADQHLSGAPSKSEPIPMDQIGAVAGKQYHGDGLSVAATPEGARLRCIFQKLEGQVTREGLWLSSTTEASKSERFRVVAAGIGRVTPCAPTEARDGKANNSAHGVTRPTAFLTRTGKVEVADQVVRFIRPGMIEEYTVSVDGLRQDFILDQRPVGPGQLRVELDVSGARVEPLVNGARLLLEGLGRKIAYSRLRATDAQGKELTATMAVLADTRLAVLVDDAEATYPVRIDPTFSDANWISLGTVPGADGNVLAAVVDSVGSLYIGGDFTVVRDVIANRIAKWDGSAWSALGSGMNSYVSALALSGSDLYAGGDFTYATNVGPSAVNVNYIAKWDGSAWSALGSGV
ncbi:MAG: hypothetical protein NT167_29785, partial [Verrucomicrobia bacterium]|nr:hypothetical protein [Verrucomicrobiota bacterium]